MQQRDNSSNVMNSKLDINNFNPIYLKPWQSCIKKKEKRIATKIIKIENTAFKRKLQVNPRLTLNIIEKAALSTLSTLYSQKNGSTRAAINLISKLY